MRYGHLLLAAAEIIKDYVIARTNMIPRWLHHSRGAMDICPLSHRDQGPHEWIQHYLLDPRPMVLSHFRYPPWCWFCGSISNFRQRCEFPGSLFPRALRGHSSWYGFGQEPAFASAPSRESSYFSIRHFGRNRPSNASMKAASAGLPGRLAPGSKPRSAGPIFQPYRRSHPIAAAQLLVSRGWRAVAVNEIPDLPGGELEQVEADAATVQRSDHPTPRKQQTVAAR